MLTEPVDLDREELRETLARGWRIDVASLDYRPLGFGSHHWVVIDPAGSRWFATVDDLRSGRAGEDRDAAFAALESAFLTARMLRDEGKLEFVVAPLLDRDGSVLRRVGLDYAVSLFPFIDGESFGFGEYRSERDRHEVLRLLGRLHEASPVLPSGLTRHDDLTVPRRAELLEALGQVDAPWTTGPFAEPTRLLLQSSAENLRTALDRYDSLVAEVSASTSSWVVTHGEPHTGNFIRDRQDRLLLIDWDTVALGPPERDLWMVVGDEQADLAAYSNAARSAKVSPRAMQLYRLWWTLADIAEFVSWFRGPHDRSADKEAGWTFLSRALPIRSELLD
ncbi:MAG: phosphotransferase [Chloroflexia bacterium]|nr:phosphotransferase [Chloroflexia bacterium]